MEPSPLPYIPAYPENSEKGGFDVVPDVLRIVLSNICCVSFFTNTENDS